MTLPLQFHNRYVSVKYFLNSYRALSDGEASIRLLEDKLKSDRLFFSDWKILWIGTCAILRTSIGLFKIDARSCINAELRKSINQEWMHIKDHETDHSIFWKFF
ncbi:MAG: hypothetical protein M3O03_01030 [Pseudomonadota bacterium]|nr:hypothetical protein [Pseudomonadota bacterium]